MKCPACGSERIATARRREGLRMLLCRECHLGFSCHAVEPEVYDQAYFDRWGYREGSDGPLAAMKRLNYGRLLDMLPGIRSVIDIGCGLGYSVEEAAARGHDAHGTEINPYARKRMPERITEKAPDRTFDAVTMIDVIEHVDRAEPLLALARKLLVPGGRLLLTTPDLSSVTARLMGNRWPHFNREHLLYFDRGTVRKSLHSAGFTTTQVRTFVKVMTPGYVRFMLADRPDSALPGPVRSAIRAMPRWFDTLRIPISTGDLVAVARL